MLDCTQVTSNRIRPCHQLLVPPRGVAPIAICDSVMVSPAYFLAGVDINFGKLDNQGLLKNSVFSRCLGIAAHLGRSVHSALGLRLRRRTIEGCPRGLMV